MKLEQGKRYWLQTRTGSYRSMYNEIQVVGETSRSYIIASVTATGDVDWSTRKIPKTLKEYHVGSKEDAILFRWCINNRHALAQALGASYEEDLIYPLALRMQHDCPWLKESIEKLQEETRHVQEKSNQSSTTEVADSNGAGKA